jgi:hypothetical protein
LGRQHAINQVVNAVLDAQDEDDPSTSTDSYLRNAILGVGAVLAKARAEPTNSDVERVLYHVSLVCPMSPATESGLALG